MIRGIVEKGLRAVVNKEEGKLLPTLNWPLLGVIGFGVAFVANLVMYIKKRGQYAQ